MPDFDKAEYRKMLAETHEVSKQLLDGNWTEPDPTVKDRFDWRDHGRACKEAYQPNPDRWTCPHIDAFYAKDEDTVTSACPTCGDVAERTIYDIGSGPECACASCEWCWSPLGAKLLPLDAEAIRRDVDAAKKKWESERQQS